MSVVSSDFVAKKKDNLSFSLPNFESILFVLRLFRQCRFTLSAKRIDGRPLTLPYDTVSPRSLNLSGRGGDLHSRPSSMQSSLRSMIISYQQLQSICDSLISRQDIVAEKIQSTEFENTPDDVEESPIEKAYSPAESRRVDELITYDLDRRKEEIEVHLEVINELETEIQNIQTQISAKEATILEFNPLSLSEAIMKVQFLSEIVLLAEDFDIEDYLLQIGSSARIIANCIHE
ncbi:MAG: hypothetical protein AAFN09_11955 [Pseudomonadota bacterium]